MAQLRRLYQRVRPARVFAGKERWFIGLWQSIDRTCAYCSRPLKLGEATRDHVVPQSAGGGQFGNIVPACQRCNNSKGNLSAYAWLATTNIPNQGAVLKRIERLLAMHRRMAGR